MKKQNINTELERIKEDLLDILELGIDIATPLDFRLENSIINWYNPEFNPIKY